MEVRVAAQNSEIAKVKYKMKMPVRNLQTNKSVSKSEVKIKPKGWMFERNVSKIPARDVETTTVVTDYKIKLPVRNLKTSPSVSKSKINTKPKGWMYEREVLQAPARNAETTTVITEYKMKMPVINLKTNTFVSKSEEKSKPKGWMFERQVLDSSTNKALPKFSVPVRNFTGKTCSYDLQKNHATRSINVEPAAIETIDLTKSDSSQCSVSVITAPVPSRTRILQDPILITVRPKQIDVMDENNSSGSEPPKKKARNAFDVLMRRDRKILPSTCLRIV